MEDEVGTVHPGQKSVTISIKGTHHQQMVDAAVLEAAVFLEMKPSDLAVLSCSAATPIQYTRFPTDLNHDVTPELWEMYVRVGVPIPDDPDKKKRKS